MINDYIWDVETYPDAFTLAAEHADSDNCWFFEISYRCNDVLLIVEFVRAVKACGGRLVGYNSIGFDYPVLHWILENYRYGVTAGAIYEVAMKIINTPFDNRFNNHIKAHLWHCDQIDLFLIHHFDNVARATSLKVLEFNMRSESVEDLPYPPGSRLQPEQIEVLGRYNRHDVKQTKKFYFETVDHIEFRQSLSVKYDHDFMNDNDTKIGKQFFTMELERLLPGSCYDIRGGKRQTPRDYIALNSVVFPYISFERPEFQAVADWIRSRTITETKGVFLEITESDLGPVAQYSTMREKRRRLAGMLRPGAWVDETRTKAGVVTQWEKWREADNLNVTLDGFRFDFGTGGIHGSIESETVYSDAENVLIDLDVASYYPNIAIKNRIYPEHLGVQFCDIYLDVYEQRKAHKKAGNDAEQKMLKLALNGVYGDSNSKYSVFYDPAYTMAVTINGQLLLCLLAEQLLKVPGLRMVQINTDGLTVRIPRVYVDHLNAVKSWWENFTLLELEAVEYSRMFIRDVNNYIGEYTNGKLKRKGKYEWQLDKDGGTLQWYQNHSALIVPKAAEAALVRGENIGDFIRGHNEWFDFMCRTKVPRSSRLEIGGVPAQNVTRYVVSTNGGAMIKIMPPDPKKPGSGERKIGIAVGSLVTECNNLRHFNPSVIDYDWYINEANKLVNPCKN